MSEKERSKNQKGQVQWDECPMRGTTPGLRPKLKQNEYSSIR